MINLLVHQIKKGCTPIQEAVKGDNYTLETWIKFITESYFHDNTRHELCNIVHFLYTNNLITPDDLHNINHSVFDCPHFVASKVEYEHKYWLKAQVSLYSTLMSTASDTSIIVRAFCEKFRRELLGGQLVPLLASPILTDEEEIRKRNKGKKLEEQEIVTEIHVSSKIDHFLGNMQSFLMGMNMYKAYSVKKLDDTLTYKIMLIMDNRVKSLIAQTAFIQAKVRILCLKQYNLLQCNSLKTELDTLDSVISFMEKEYIHWIVAI